MVIFHLLLVYSMNAVYKLTRQSECPPTVPNRKKLSNTIDSRWIKKAFGKKRNTTGRSVISKRFTKKSAVKINEIRKSNTSFTAIKYGFTCDAKHEGRLVLKAQINKKVDDIYNLIFSPTSEFLRKFHERRKTTDLNLGAWQRNSNGEQQRIVRMTVAIVANVGPKSARITERQTLRSCSNPGEGYAVDVCSENEGIPYADVFNISIHYCIYSLTDSLTEILVYGDVNFLKTTWGVVKLFITKNSLEGLEEFFYDLNQQLQLLQ